MRRFLIPGERKGYKSLETLIVIQRVESDQTLPEYSIGVSGRRSADEIQDLGSYFLRQNCHSVVKLRLADGQVPDSKLGIRLGETKPPPRQARRWAASWIHWLLQEQLMEMGERVPRYPPCSVLYLQLDRKFSYSSCKINFITLLAISANHV